MKRLTVRDQVYQSEDERRELRFESHPHQASDCLLPVSIVVCWSRGKALTLSVCTQPVRLFASPHTIETWHISKRCASMLFGDIP
jgi:hypothetical protein